LTIDETTTKPATIPDEAPVAQRVRRARHTLRSKPVPIAAVLVAVGSAVAIVVRRRRAAHKRWRPAFLNR
jgi:hypothetical protein